MGDVRSGAAADVHVRAVFSRAQTYRDVNPFSGSVSRNCHEACCEAREMPKLQPRALATEPERLDTCHLIAGGDALEGASTQPPTVGPHDPRGGLRTVPPAEHGDPPEDALADLEC